jgi:hypothetical protein
LAARSSDGCSPVKWSFWGEFSEGRWLNFYVVYKVASFSLTCYVEGASPGVCSSSATTERVVTGAQPKTKVVHETVANLSHLSPALITLIEQYREVGQHASGARDIGAWLV